MDHQNKNRAQGKLAKLLLVNYAMRRASYLVRGVAGGYVVYLMVQLFTESSAGEEGLTPLMGIIGVLMTAVGVYFLVSAVYALFNGIYSENAPTESEEEQAEPEKQLLESEIAND